MRFKFDKNSKNRTSSFIVHIVEHEGYGTLHQLVHPLQNEQNQKVFFTHDMSVFRFNTVDNYILHVTGHMYPIISNLEIIFRKKIKFSIFLHVAPGYYHFKKEKLLFLDYLEYIQHKYNVKIFCPSKKEIRKGKNENNINIKRI